ncbi:S41 family peptidase, partial [Pedobacter sp. ASV28]|uniref:S41 family peptidase n=1 Tax=Pedobacter sp. ASV28 TaxID=2795123 RepID=UPI0018ED067E
MRLYKSKKFYLLFTLALILISCKKEKQVVQLLPEDRQWILDSMQVYYYWADQLPNYPLQNGSSISFFKSLLYSKDRFSYIEDPENLPSTYSSFAYYGFEYALMESTAFPGRLLGIITLVVPNGPAAKRGLKRGDIFTTVNGVELSNTTVDKINQLLKLGADIAIQTASIEKGQLVGKASYVISYAYFREQPVYLTKLFTNGNKKVGYVFYNGFYEEFDRNILDSISKFKNGGISDLILDLRYNPGGAVSSAAKIAAAIAPVSETQTFIISKANKNGGQFIETFAQSINKGNTYPGTFSQVSAYRINIHT